MKLNTKINNSWQDFLEKESKKDYFKKIITKIQEDKNEGITIFPEEKNIFSAFEKTPFDKVKVVILGQDPYHGEGQAQGFCFGVKEGVKLPPSLKNIYKELNASLGIENSDNGDLSHWAEQGVLLLNSSLTVQKSKPASHSKIGWEIFTDNAIREISEKKQNVVFLLWGAFAQSKENLINKDKHFVLKTTHPSPFSAYRGFLGSDVFKKTNEILKSIGEQEIDWKIK